MHIDTVSYPILENKTLFTFQRFKLISRMDLNKRKGLVDFLVFFFFIDFQLMTFVFNYYALYNQTKILIGF